MAYTIRGNKIVAPDAVINGLLILEEGKIAEIIPGVTNYSIDYDFGDAWILPGFIDPHLHGLLQFNVGEASAIEEIALAQPCFGTTSFLPTATAMTDEEFIESGRQARTAAAKTANSGARILGLHLEGPFLNPEAAGAIAEETRRPVNLQEAKHLVDELGDVLKLMTLSPELENGAGLIALLKQNGVVVSLGHSIAAADSLDDYINAGLSYVTHLFNAFPLSGEAEPGVLESGLIEHILASDQLCCEIICDLQHVAREWIIIAGRVLEPDRFIAITDSLCGAGLESGRFDFADGSRYHLVDGVARLEQDNRLAGSTLTMNKAFVNLLSCGISPALASRFTSLNAAKVLQLDSELGSLETGKCADIAVLDQLGNCLATFIDGALVFFKG
ncbi:N-acetylglucosamine-6-phosphate deacetylase [candidate division KSB1 bacterium]|nr:N-acetylglucosamine-6-phosphate deacetylase [candidate division KSB1 bacterium]